MKKNILIIVSVIVLLGVLGYFYVFHKPHRNISEEEARYTKTVSGLVEEYQSDPRSANDLYLDEVIAIKGVAIEISEGHITLDGGVYCTLATDTDVSKVQEGDEITIKGRVIGFDELFGEVKLDHCEIIQ